MVNQSYDLVILGAGAAGSAAASAAAGNGRRVALVERHLLGGTCLNYGCDPTKTLLHSANVLSQARQAGRFGLRIPTAEADWGEVLRQVQRAITRMRGGTLPEAIAQLQEQGIEVMQGEARFLSAHELEVGQRRLSAERVLIATGCEPMVPPVAGLREAGYLTNVEAVALPKLPRSLAVVGGGPIGLEFAQMFQRFGVEVTVLERGPRLLEKEDRELAELLGTRLAAEGVRLETSAELSRVERVGGGKRLTMRCGERQEETLEVDDLLLALGRRPSLEALKLEAAGVEANDQGVQIDATLCTSVPTIWAAGDVTGGYQFTHVAARQGELAARNAFANRPQPFDDRVIPWVTFTDPALAHVGQTEEQLREAGVDVRVGRATFAENERAITKDATSGLVKLLLDTDGQLLGGHILADGSEDLLAPVVLAMHARLPASALAELLLPYPNMAEALRLAAS